MKDDVVFLTAFVVGTTAVFLVGWALGGLDVAAAAAIIFVLAGVVLRIVTWDWRLWRD